MAGRRLIYDARVPAPILETERLILRGHVAADLDDCVAMWSDPQVVRYIGGKAATREEVWARLLRYVGHWTLAGYGFWQARERGSDRFVGEVGLADFQRGLDPAFAQAHECGWVLAPWAHGKGYATEAMTAVLAWADASPVVGPRTMCLIDEGNAASARVAEKLGYRERARVTYKDSPTVIYERDA